MMRSVSKRYRTILPNALLYLAQTDTTVGFLCQDSARINAAKKRPLDTPVIKTCSDFKKLKNQIRPLKAHKRLIRYAKKNTFIFPDGQSYRVITEGAHHDFLKNFEFLYSSSANINKQKFDLEYAKQAADQIIEDERGFFESTPSTILHLGKTKIKKFR